MWLANRGRFVEGVALGPPADSPPPAWPHPASHLRVDLDGLPVHLLRGPSTLSHEPDDAEVAAFLSVLDHLLEQARPDILLAHGADRLTAEALGRGRSRGIPGALRLRDRGPHDSRAIAAADAILVPSRALAEEILYSTGRPCEVIPDFSEPEKVRAEAGDRKYLAFFDPGPANGLTAFARIADDLGRLRPDIPILVVAGPEGREHLDRCGIDLKRHGNIDLMKPPTDPRVAWARARVALVPALDAMIPPPAAVEAVINGLPVVASDRGTLPEILGNSGVKLPLPDRLTPAIQLLPNSDEVKPWIEAIARLWDDADHYAEHRRRSAIEGRRLDGQSAARRCVDFLRDLRPRVGPLYPPPGRGFPMSVLVFGRKQELTLRQESSGEEEETRNSETFRWNPAGERIPPGRAWPAAGSESCVGAGDRHREA